MHTYIDCSTIHNSKDMESTQMPINDRLNNVVCIQHEILCSHKKEQDHVLCRGMDGAQSHYPQPTSARNRKPNTACFHFQWTLNNENT